MRYPCRDGLRLLQDLRRSLLDLISIHCALFILI
jgi:hypothetical protein